MAKECKLEHIPLWSEKVPEQNLTQNTGDPERKGEDNEGMFLDAWETGVHTEVHTVKNKQKSSVTQARKIGLFQCHEVQEQ